MLDNNKEAHALPDGLYGILTEYVRHFDGLLFGLSEKA